MQTYMVKVGNGGTIWFAKKSNTNFTDAFAHINKIRNQKIYILAW